MRATCKSEPCSRLDNASHLQIMPIDAVAIDFENRSLPLARLFFASKARSYS
jgi:hypothetical protein